MVPGELTASEILFLNRHGFLDDEIYDARLKLPQFGKTKRGNLASILYLAVPVRNRDTGYGQGLATVSNVIRKK